MKSCMRMMSSLSGVLAVDLNLIIFSQSQPKVSYSNLDLQFNKNILFFTEKVLIYGRNSPGGNYNTNCGTLEWLIGVIFMKLLIPPVIILLCYHLL